MEAQVQRAVEEKTNFELEIKSISSKRDEAVDRLQTEIGKLKETIEEQRAQIREVISA